MSETAQGPGWWQASDGKWYSPEQVPGQQPAADPDPDVSPGEHAGGTGPVASTFDAPSGYAQPTSPFDTPPAYGMPPPASSPPVGPYGAPAGPYGTPPPIGGSAYPATGPYGYAMPPKTNGLAIASMVCSFFFFIYGIPAVLAIVFGFISRSQIRRSNGTQTGSGMALAGIIVGIAGLVIGVILIIVVVAVFHHCTQNGTCTSGTIS
jgi:hypothetical protein